MYFTYYTSSPSWGLGHHFESIQKRPTTKADQDFLYECLGNGRQDALVPGHRLTIFSDVRDVQI